MQSGNPNSSRVMPVGIRAPGLAVGTPGASWCRPAPRGAGRNPAPVPPPAGTPRCAGPGMLAHNPCAWVRTGLSGASSSHFLALLGYLEQAEPDLPPRGGSATATGIRVQERGQDQPLHKIFRFPAEFLLNTVRAQNEADRRSPYAAGRARLPRVPRSGSGRWARS